MINEKCPHCGHVHEAAPIAPPKKAPAPTKTTPGTTPGKKPFRPTKPLVVPKPKAKEKTDEEMPAL